MEVLHMRIISFVTQKGGTGKSTLALNLAVTAQLCGERVIIVDLDPQGTAVSWHKTRKAEGPAAIDSRTAGQLGETLRQLATAGFTLAMIDTPGTDNEATHGAMRASDLCLVPVRPSEADVRATMPTLRALSAMGRPYALVVNQALPRVLTTSSNRLDNAGPVLPVAIAARIDHQYAYAMGQGVQEFAPHGKAAAEILALWHAVRNRIGSNDDGEAASDGLPAVLSGWTQPAIAALRERPRRRPLAVGPRLS
jgi:chromosome partitioning protein